ncbi:MAG TPA: hypothetical protein VFR11_08620 [Micromonosporaceae bacterium]|nr:hypothetical protein [Micromonosporaceae bacterium]
MNDSYLWAYPKAYRQEHGPEILSTLMDATDGRPSLRDRASLALAGLRMRASQPHGQPLRTHLRLVVQFAVALFLVHSMTSVQGITWGIATAQQGAPWWPIVPAALVLVVVGLAWFVPGRALAAACALLGIYYLIPTARFGWLPAVIPGPSDPKAWALLLFGGLVLGRDRMPRPWLAILAVIAAVPIVEWFTPTVPWVPQILISVYAAVLVALVAVWALVDARPLASLAVYAVVATADTQLLQLRDQPAGISFWTLHGWQPFLPALASLLLLPLAVWRVRRQSAL